MKIGDPQNEEGIPLDGSEKGILNQTFGLSVQNNFVTTGEVPDLETFKANIPKIEWSVE